MELQLAVRVILILFFVVAVAIPVHAGNNEIKQCQTIDVSGPYVLTQNIEPSTRAGGNCLVIAADFVTIDLAGYSIIGHSGGYGITDAVTDTLRRGLTIRGGFIRNFKSGIYLLQSRDLTIENMYLFDNMEYGTISGTVSVVRNNIATGNKFGISAHERSIVTGNNSSDNLNLGIFAGTGSTIIGNVTSSNGGGGLLANGSSTVQNNTAHLNGSTGISVGVGGAVIANSANGNGLVDFFVSASCTREHNNPAP